MKIIIDQERCVGCGVCAKVCPQRVLEVADKKMRVRDEKRCMGCFGCEDECPHGAVRVLRKAQSTESVAIEPAPQGVSSCDVAVVGAGPSGLGAAIACARAGLDVVVFERLSNRRLSHHPDGGTLFAFPGVVSMKVDSGRVSFPELDITIAGDFARPCRSLGLLGPAGLSTQSTFPKGVEGWAGHKDTFIEALANEAEKSGARLWYGAKVVDVLRDGDAVTGVRLHSGEEIQSRAVVAADGVMAKISEKAGMHVSHEDVWYAQVLAFEYDNSMNLPASLYYINGEMPFGEGTPPAFGAIAITRVIHVLAAFFTRQRFYAAPEPMDNYVRRLLADDLRVRRVLGDRFDGTNPRMLTGCRVVLRAVCNTDTAGDGVVSVGDAWVDDGEIGNVPALANGVYAGRVIAEAARKNDFSKRALAPVNQFAPKRFLKALAKNKEMKLLATKLTEEEMRQMFLFMQHMNYPVMFFGGPVRQTLMFTRFMFMNFVRFFRYPKIARLMF